MTSTQTLRKWGNTAAVRLPKKVIEAAHARLDQEFEVSVHGRTIVLTPAKPQRGQSLERLLEGVKPSDVGGEVDWGLDVGNERYA